MTFWVAGAAVVGGIGGAMINSNAAGKAAKGNITTGSRVWCSESGISEQEIGASDAPKHLEQVLAKFDTFLNLAKQNLKK